MENAIGRLAAVEFAEGAPKFAEVAPTFATEPSRRTRPCRVRLPKARPHSGPVDGWRRPHPPPRFPRTNPISDPLSHGIARVFYSNSLKIRSLWKSQSGRWPGPSSPKLPGSSRNGSRRAEPESAGEALSGSARGLKKIET